LLLALPATAHAKEMVGSSNPRWYENPPKRYQSSQWFAFELKFGPYTPHIDDAPGLRGKPFGELFNQQPNTGQPSYKLLTQFEFDFQFLHRSFGSLAIGHQIGFYRRTTHAFEYPATVDGMPVKDANGNVINCVSGSCTRSGDETALNVFPIEIMLVYRFDLLALRYKIPFVPYLKLGLAYYIWWIEDGGGIFHIAEYTDASGTHKAQGGTWGWVANPGLAFMLDVIDPTAARTIDAELGINHSYLFCELHYADITGFGDPSKLWLSDLTLNAGLAFEF
jgi:hypothetical protein